MYWSYRIIVIAFSVVTISGACVKASDCLGSSVACSELVAAGILPVCTGNSQMVILGKETNHGFSGSEKYDYFAGQADLKDNNNSLVAAMREFYEEGLLKYTWKEHFDSKDHIASYIKKNIRACVIFAINDTDAHKKQHGVMYVVGMDTPLTTSFFTGFNDACRLPKNAKSLEKDELIEVSYEDLLDLANGKKKSLQILKSTSKSSGLIKRNQLRDSLALLLNAIKEENKVEAHVPFPTYMLAKYASFNMIKQSREYTDGYVLAEGEKNSLFNKIKEDLAHVEESLTCAKTREKGLPFSPQNSSWFKNSKLVLFSGATIAILIGIIIKHLLHKQSSLR